MKTNSGNDLDGKKHRTKSHSAIPMIGAIVTGVLLLAGLSLMGNYNVVTAQEMTETPGTEGAAPGTECPAPGTEGAAPGTEGPTAFGGTAETNATGVEGNDQMSQVRMYLEEARTALQNNDTQTALTCLDQALNQLGAVTGTEANMTGTAPETNMTPETEGAAPETEDGGDGGPLEGIFGGGG
jgi:hypothetical protein